MLRHGYGCFYTCEMYACVARHEAQSVGMLSRAAIWRKCDLTANTWACCLEIKWVTCIPSLSLDCITNLAWTRMSLSFAKEITRGGFVLCRTG